MTPVFRCLAILLVVSAAGCGGSPYPPNIKVGREPAKGLTPADLDDHYLTSLTNWTREAAQQRLAETYERNEVPPERRTGRVRVQSRYLESGGKRLAVIDLAYTGNPVRVARVVGLKDDALVTVSCTSPDGAPLRILDAETACGQAVQDIFLD